VKLHQALVLLPGFQKGRDIKVSKGKGQGAVLANDETMCYSARIGVKTLKIK
jgi:hypothetical protein